MKRASIAATFVFSAACWASGPASAQETAAAVEQEADDSMVTTSPKPVSQQEWWQADLEEAEQRSRATRNALIGTSAGFAVGVIMFGVGLSQCQSVPSSTGSNQDELLCNQAGNVLVPLGGTISFLGFVGMLTSGIMLGVSNKRKRQIQRDMRRGYQGARLQWEPASGGFVF